MVIPASSGDEQKAIKRRLMVKGGVAFLLVAVLLIIGNRGRHQAGLQDRLDAILDLRGELQQQLNVNESLPPDIGRPPGKALPGFPPLPLSSRQALESLKMELANFGADYPPGSLSAREDLRLRVCQGTVANAEGRFADALSIITDQDVRQGERETQARITTDVLEVRGGAFYGLGKWQEALSCYDRILALQPDRVSSRKRAGECQYALGHLTEASSAFAQLAKSCNQRGEVFLVLGRPEAAMRELEPVTQIESEISSSARSVEFAELLITNQTQLGNALLVLGKAGPAAAQYEKALAIATSLSDQRKQDNLAIAIQLAWLHNNLGNALLAQEKAPLAEVEYQKAIELRAGSGNLPAGGKPNGTLAATYKGIGDAALAQGKLEAASADYGKAVELFEAAPQPGASQELGVSYNNRGVARRLQGNVEAALSDFEKAIATLVPIARPPGHSGPDTGISSEVPQSGAVQLDVLFRQGEHGIGVLTRTRVIGEKGKNEAALAMATSLQNHGYVLLLRGDVHGAEKEYHQAADIYAMLVEEEAQSDLTMEFAHSLSELAWIQATSADATVAEHAEPKQYALKACELSEWRAVEPIEALAAACAGRAEFEEAVKWQQKAFELAPEKRKAELMGRLQLYKSGRPYLRHTGAAGSKP